MMASQLLAGFLDIAVLAVSQDLVKMRFCACDGRRPPPGQLVRHRFGRLKGYVMRSTQISCLDKLPSASDPQAKS